MRTDYIDYRGLLTNEQMTSVVQHKATLLFGRFGRHKPHVRPRDRLTNSLGVRSIVFLAIDVGLHIGRRHKSHRMAKSLQFTRPMMRRGASFDSDKARRQLLEECQHIAALNLTAEDHLTLGANAVDLKKPTLQYRDLLS
jgi:hypothetical protein